MIPALVSIPGSPWNVLPPGIHTATFAEVEAVFAYNAHRRVLFGGLLDASVHLAGIGCSTVLLDGSYVSAKPVPDDYDACWDPHNIDWQKLDPVFEDFDNGRAQQKARFGGEFFPSTMIAADIGAPFPVLFQKDRFTGQRKGILSIAIGADPAVAQRIKP